MRAWWKLYVGDDKVQRPPLQGRRARPGPKLEQASVIQTTASGRVADARPGQQESAAPQPEAARRPRQLMRASMRHDASRAPARPGRGGLSELYRAGASCGPCDAAGNRSSGVGTEPLHVVPTQSTATITA